MVLLSGAGIASREVGKGRRAARPEQPKVAEFGLPWLALLRDHGRISCSISYLGVLLPVEKISRKNLVAEQANKAIVQARATLSSIAGDVGSVAFPISCDSSLLCSFHPGRIWLPVISRAPR